MSLAKRLTFTNILLILGLCAIFFPATSYANTDSNTVTVSPPLQSIELEDGQASHRSTIIFSNHYDYPISLDLSISDFGDLEDGGGLFFLGTGPQADQKAAWQKQHGLERWIELSHTQLAIPAQSQATTAITIQNEDSLNPGGHYAAIMASITSTGPDISINQSISSLLFVNKQGGHQYNLEINNLEPQSSWWGMVEGAAIGIQNTGNTHLVPRGKLELIDPLGRMVGQGIINPNSSILLPGADQQFNSSLISHQPPWLPGNYELVLSYRYNDQDIVSTLSTSTFNLGLLIPALFLVSLIATIVFIIYRRRQRSA